MKKLLLATIVLALAGCIPLKPGLTELSSYGSPKAKVNALRGELDAYLGSTSSRSSGKVICFADRKVSDPGLVKLRFYTGSKWQPLDEGSYAPDLRTAENIIKLKLMCARLSADILAEDKEVEKKVRRSQVAALTAKNGKYTESKAKAYAKSIKSSVKYLDHGDQPFTIDTVLGLIKVGLIPEGTMVIGGCCGLYRWAEQTTEGYVIELNAYDKRTLLHRKKHATAYPIVLRGPKDKTVGRQVSGAEMLRFDGLTKIDDGSGLEIDAVVFTVLGDK